jgi:hypothetical protein
MTPFQRDCALTFLHTGRFAKTVICSVIAAFALSRLFLTVVPLIDGPLSDGEVWIMFAVLGFWYLQAHCFFHAYFKARS